ncbi:MAG: hypothetical protein DMF61_04515 [Blastocatellia bacterium AA13]|nr:MAG: hypothetical protein DMF61_04515 [Blastocatellia bacterium AA13]
MKHIITAAILAGIFCTSAAAQGTSAKAGSPTETAIQFYRALRDKRYVEGLSRSVYRGAVEGLTSDELRDLEPDFARTFSSIPAKVEAGEEKTEGDTATVFLKFEGLDQPQQVTLLKINREWLVGDRDALAAVKEQGRAFFFNTRMAVNEAEAYELILRVVSAEILYGQRHESTRIPLSELIKLGAVPQDVQEGNTGGYQLKLTLSPDSKSFVVTASPDSYGKTGRLSFYGDGGGVRAEDLKGRPATAKSPIYRPST